MKYEDLEDVFIRNLSFKVNKSSSGRTFSITTEFDSESIKAELEDEIDFMI